MTGNTGKSILVAGPCQLQMGSSMGQDVIDSLHAPNVVEARNIISGWRGNTTAMSAGIICDIDIDRLTMAGKMGVGPRISMKTLWGIEDAQLRLQLSFTKDTM